MRTSRVRAVSILSLACAVLTFLTTGAASASASVSVPPLLTWSQPQPTGATSAIKSVSCPSKTFCAAVDTGGEALTFNGTTWSAPVTIDPAYGGLGSVSCSSATFCVAVDNAGNILGYNGTKWKAPISIDGTNYLTSVSCKTSTFCVSVDGDHNAVQTPGAAKGESQVIDPALRFLVSVPARPPVSASP